MATEHRPYYIQSPLVELYWHGWRSNTRDLQRHGWQFAVDQDYYSRMLRIIMRNEKAGLYGVSNPMPYDHRIDDYYSIRETKGSEHYSTQMSVAEKITVETQSAVNLYDRFIPIDTNPCVRMIEQDLVSLDQLDVFRPVEQSMSKEIYLQEASMDEILEFALAKQEPTQEEIRKRLMTDARLEDIRTASEPIAQLRLVV